MIALRKRWTAFLILSAVAVGMLVFWLMRSKPTAETPPRYDIPRTISYSFTLTNTTPRLLQQADFWVYAPVKQTATQKVVALEASLPYQLITDTLGNQILHFTLTDLPPFGSRLISIKAQLLMAQTPNPLPAEPVEHFLRAEKYIESDHPRIQTLASTLIAIRPLATAQQMYQWVVEHVRYSGYVRDDRGALYALEKQQGDCTEYAYLFTALTRAGGIPARSLGGYVYSEDTVLKAQDYHNWAEFYADGTWHLADPQKRAFLNGSAAYIALRIIADEATPILGNAHRFSYTGEGLRVRMN